MRGCVVERTFKRHEVRKSYELGGLWQFSVTRGEKEETRQVAVPSCWETYPGFEDYRGIAKYETKVNLSGNVRIAFKGVSHQAKVYLDKNLVGEHNNGYTPFDVIIKGVKPGEHTLSVEVDNSFNEESALYIPNDHKVYGGITRPVILEKIPNTYIKWVHFTPFKEDHKWHGKVEIALCNISEVTQTIKVEVELGKNHYVFYEGEIQKGEVKLKKDLVFEGVEAYELENPMLYFLKVNLGFVGDINQSTMQGTIKKQCTEYIDDLIERIGFREISIKGNEILFNDKPLKIKGFNRHEDHALFGSAIPYEAMVYDLNLIEDMGANAIRTSHYPNDERFLDLCDEKGILIWEEAHARGLSEAQMKHKNFKEQSLACIKEMIENHYNHPSIFMWGILNECASHTEYGHMCYMEQLEKIQKLDVTRPTTFASCHYNEDICLGLPDVVSMNIYPGWYHNVPIKAYCDKVREWVQTTHGEGKPYIVSEIGAGAIYGYHTMSKAKWSEEKQRDLLKEQLEAVLSNEEIVGVFIWQFSDCKVAEEEFATRPKCQNNKGVVDEYRRPKLAYEIVKEIYHKY